MRHGRVVLAFILLLGVLTASPRASAQAPGSELAEAVASDAAGDEAYVTLASVEAFPVDGGEAIFEPDSPYEETFTYANVDAESNRLVGLTRSAPLAHSAGAFVQAPEPAVPSTPPPTSSPTPSPDEADSNDGSTRDSTGDDDLDGGGDAGSGGEAATSGDDPTPSSETPDPCENITGKTCLETLLALVSNPCDPLSTGQTCEQYLSEWLVEISKIASDPCGYINIDCGLPDPCDPDNTGQTCEQYLSEWLVEISEIASDPCGYINIDCGLSDPCDPGNTGQTCAEYLGETVPMTGLWIDPPIIIPLVEVNEDGSLHPCSVNPEIDKVSYNHGWFATNVDVHGDSHIESDCRTLVEDLHAEVHITTSTRTQLASPLGSSSSSDSCDSETPGVCNNHLLHQYPAWDSWPSTISWRFYF